MRKSVVTLVRFTVSNVIEKLMEHSIHCQPYSFTNDIIDLLLQQLLCHTDFKVMSLECHYVKVLNTTVGYSLVAMVTD